MGSLKRYFLGKFQLPPCGMGSNYIYHAINLPTPAIFAKNTRFKENWWYEHGMIWDMLFSTYDFII